ncbi:hypothetical protein [Sinomicrobium sp. M5D2P9]
MNYRPLILPILFLVQFACFSQGEIVLTGGTGSDIGNAINSINDQGSIVLKGGNYLITTNLIIPEKITLTFSENAKIILNTGVQLTLNGNIKTGLSHIFEVNDGAKIIGNSKLERIYPHWWGAVQNDEAPDDKGIEEALKFILNRQKASTRIKINNSKTSNSNIILDFAGGEFILENKIQLPETSAFQLVNGIIKASDNFTDDFLFDTYIEKTGNNPERRFNRENITFNEIILNCHYKASGIRLANSIRWVFDKFSVYDIPENKSGILIHGESNEIMILNSFFINKDDYYFDEGVEHRTGTGIKLENNGTFSNSDHHFSNIVMKGLEYGIRSIGSTANVYDKIHIYDSFYGIKLEGNTSANRITTCYFDNCKLNIGGPKFTSVTNCYFIYVDDDVNYAPFEIEANWTGQNIRGFTATNNIFQSTIPIEAFKILTPGNFYFNQDQIFDTYIMNNTSDGNVNIRGTHYTINNSLPTTPTNDIVKVDVSKKHLIGKVQEFYLGITNHYGGAPISGNFIGVEGNFLKIKLSNPMIGNLHIKVVTSENMK